MKSNDLHTPFCTQWHERRGRHRPEHEHNGKPRSPSELDAGDTEDEETVDQQVAASRQRIKALIRALSTRELGTPSPGSPPRTGSPGMRRSKLDLRVTTAMNRGREEGTD